MSLSSFISHVIFSHKLIFLLLIVLHWRGRLTVWLLRHHCLRIHWLSVLVIDLLSIGIDHRNHHHLSGLLHTWLHHGGLHHHTRLLMLLVGVDRGAHSNAWICLLHLVHLHLLFTMFVLLLLILLLANRST